MTDLEFVYKKLCENPIQSSKWTFIFDCPNEYSLCDFNVLENNIGKFGKQYLIEFKNNEFIVRIYTISGQKKLVLETNKENRPVVTGPNFLEVPIEDLLYLLLNEQWVVEDNISEN